MENALIWIRSAIIFTIAQMHLMRLDVIIVHQISSHAVMAVALMLIIDAIEEWIAKMGQMKLLANNKVLFWYILVRNALNTFFTEACTSNEFRCNDGTCIDSRMRCDSRYDCLDGSDEVNCQCHSLEFRCSNGQCINESLRCMIWIYSFIIWFFSKFWFKIFFDRR